MFFFEIAVIASGAKQSPRSSLPASGELLLLSQGDCFVALLLAMTVYFSALGPQKKAAESPQRLCATEFLAILHSPGD
jgi:hypothetical protein